MSAIIIFDVSGKIYKSSETVFEKYPDSVLSMLVRRHGKKDEPLFLNRDQKLFRWILNFYQSDILVDHNTVGVPVEIWDAEIDFFMINDLVKEDESNVKVFGDMKKEKQLKRRNPDDDAFAILCKERKKILSQKKEALLEERRVKYRKLIQYLINGLHAEHRTAWNMIEPYQRHLDYWNADYPDIFREVRIDFIRENFKEIVDFAKEYGFRFEISDAQDHCASKSKSHNWWPANNQPFTHMHKCLIIYLSIIQENNKDEEE